MLRFHVYVLMLHVHTQVAFALIQSQIFWRGGERLCKTYFAVRNESWLESLQSENLIDEYKQCMKNQYTSCNPCDEGIKRQTEDKEVSCVPSPSSSVFRELINGPGRRGQACSPIEEGVEIGFCRDTIIMAFPVMIKTMYEMVRNLNLTSCQENGKGIKGNFARTTITSTFLLSLMLVLLQHESEIKQKTLVTEFHNTSSSPKEGEVLGQVQTWEESQLSIPAYIKAYIHEEVGEVKLCSPTTQQANEREDVGPSDSTQSPPRPSIASDGFILDNQGDPPGQQSSYIIPGDARLETYRLSTFAQFPPTCPVDYRALARAGFFFTGFFDRVKCFACAISVERWTPNDDPNDAKWHRPTCPLTRGEQSGNIPIGGRLLSDRGLGAQRQAGEQVVEQRDPVTGALIRTVRFAADLPDRIRNIGGTFEIGPNGNVVISSNRDQQPQNYLPRGNGSYPRPATTTNLFPHNASATTRQAVTSAAPARQWRMANVVSSDHRRFLSNLFLNREIDRLTSFARWPVSRPNISPASLARSGFFYLGDLDRTQCFSCGGVLRNWMLEDEADEEHRSHFPTCPMTTGSEPRNIPVPNRPETQEQRQIDYPCHHPANPHMRNNQLRLETFEHGWERGKVRAAPEQIAEAGFFYLGERDRVKCWYCNGGLQNWEYEDKPWEEHAKWFPNCQFVLQNKGQMFVHQLLTFNPHLARPIIAKQEGSPLDTGGSMSPESRSTDIPPEHGNARAPPSGTPVIIDPMEITRKKQERIDRIMKDSQIVAVVLTMGFEEKLVRTALEEKINKGEENNAEDVFDGVQALLEAVMEKESQMQQDEEEEEEEEMPGSSCMQRNFLYRSTNYPFQVDHRLQ